MLLTCYDFELGQKLFLILHILHGMQLYEEVNVTVDATFWRVFLSRNVIID